MDKNLKPLVSVLMPVYNCAAYVRDAVESILTQTFTNFELIIIDDCSTDQTKEIIRSYSDQRICFFEKKENSGLSDSLNAGIKMAKGTYIARMDGDDIAEKKRLEIQYDFLEQNKDIGICGSCYSIIDSNERITVPARFDEIKIASLEYNPIAHPTVFLRRSILTDHQLYYKKEYEPAEDYDLWCRLFKSTRIVNLPLILLQYRRHNNQASFVGSKKQKEKASVIRVSLLQSVDPAFQIDLEKESLQSWLAVNIRHLPDLTAFLIQLNHLNKKNQAVQLFDAVLFRNFLAGKQMESIRFFLQTKKTSAVAYASVALMIDFLLHRRSYLFHPKQLVHLLIRNW